MKIAILLFCHIRTSIQMHCVMDQSGIAVAGATGLAEH